MPEPKSFRPRSRVSDEAASAEASPRLVLGPRGDTWEQKAELTAHALLERFEGQRQGERAAEPGAFSAGAAIPTPGRLSDAAEGGSPLAPELEAKILSRQGEGQPVPGSLRPYLEKALGPAATSLRIHTDAVSDQLNGALQSQAFTVGQDIFVRSQDFQPESEQGRDMLFHEAAHAVQQIGGAGETASGRAGGDSAGADAGVQRVQRWEMPWTRKARLRREAAAHKSAEAQAMLDYRQNIPANPTVDWLIEDPRAREEVARPLCKRLYMEENLDFVLEYPSIAEAQGTSRESEVLASVINRYIRTGADQELNVDSSQRASLLQSHKAYASGAANADAVFQGLSDVNREMWTLLRGNLVMSSNFLNSEEWVSLSGQVSTSYVNAKNISLRLERSRRDREARRREG